MPLARHGMGPLRLLSGSRPHLSHAGHQAPLPLEVGWVGLPHARLPLQQAAQQRLRHAIELWSDDLAGRGRPGEMAVGSWGH